MHMKKILVFSIVKITEETKEKITFFCQLIRT